MSCFTHNITAVAGDIYSRSLKFTDNNDLPIDLSIYTEIEMQVRKNPGSPVLASATLSDGDFVISGDDNEYLEINIQVPTTPGSYKYDIEFTGTNIKETLIGGSFVVKPQITA